MKLVFSAALVGAVLFVSPVSAATLVQYDFTGATGNQASTAASNVATGLTGLSFTRGAGLNAPAGGNSINSSGFNAEATDYVSFGLNVASGFTASVNQLLLGTRSSNTGPGAISLLASLDGGAFTTIASFAQGTNDLYQSLSFTTLTATNSIVFRLTASGTTSANGGTLASGGTFRVENYVSGGTNSPVSINGSVAAAAVPEPATWAMFIGGFGLLGATLRRRQPVRVSFG
ncbi:PEPxxWA-CTERM sorting domain-containing protein [Sphingomonas sp. BIUV-7]|uniref:PEPxxWA-CTERM sorting domain-containing protein n=1 Tax=Sphingomonas natans TaxID=3063330 RepID=A0ABT8YDS9_9SPHN|nr:PEPxxWA-CTERM sorting domain-containing protein [Sphingomonas sp. BIUV-7]MDO6416508.1 PEPxxWA-CTERM sorting domain-containing protein [Sphingomonas sp. BIUV-7]